MLVQSPDFHTVTSMGITRDADYPKSATDHAVDSAFKSICGSLRHVGLPLPKNLTQKASQAGKPDINVYIMPDCQSDGMLEDLCLASLGDAVEMACVEAYVQCLEERRGVAIARHKLPKTRLNSWIASQDAPDISLGLATQRRYFDFKHPVFDQLKGFVGSL